MLRVVLGAAIVAKHSPARVEKCELGVEGQGKDLFVVLFFLRDRQVGADYRCSYDREAYRAIVRVGHV